MPFVRRQQRADDIATRYIAGFGEIPIDSASGRHSVDAVVEWGSVTKTVTSTLLDRLADDGQVDPDAPLDRWLPVPEGSAITPRLLSQHRSGLPRLPPGVRWWSRQPYVSFDDEAFLQTLRQLPQLAKSAPGPFLYSNFGYSVLGAMLAAAGQADWFSLARRYVLDPIGLADVTDQRPAVGSLVGADRSGRERAPWQLPPPMKPAGGLWSSVRSLSGYVRSVVLDQTLGPPADAWQADRTVLWHNGGTRDAAVYAGADIETGASVVVHTIGLGPVRTDKLGSSRFATV